MLHLDKGPLVVKLHRGLGHICELKEIFLMVATLELQVSRDLEIVVGTEYSTAQNIKTKLETIKVFPNLSLAN